MKKHRNAWIKGLIAILVLLGLMGGFSDQTFWGVIFIGASLFLVRRREDDEKKYDG